MQKKKSTGKSKSTFPERADDVPVTQKMLYLVRDELKEEISSNFKIHKSDTASLRSDFAGLRSEFAGLRSEFEGLRAEFAGLKTEFAGFRSEIKSEIHSFKSEMHSFKSEMREDFKQLKSEFHRVALLVEEQNARNRIVLDGLTALFTRQDRVEAEVKNFRELLVAIK